MLASSLLLDFLIEHKQWRRVGETKRTVMRLNPACLVLCLATLAWAAPLYASWFQQKTTVPVFDTELSQFTGAQNGNTAIIFQGMFRSAFKICMNLPNQIAWYSRCELYRIS